MPEHYGMPWFAQQLSERGAGGSVMAGAKTAACPGWPGGLGLSTSG